MTDIITHSTDSLLNSTNNTLTQLSVPPLENLAKSIIDTLPVLKPSTLLIKRHSSSNLDDLMVKKIKTQSTNCSDSESIFHASLSNRRTDSKTFPSLSRSGSIESVEKDDGFMLEEDFSTEGLTLTDQASKGLFYVPPLENAFPLDNLKKSEGGIPTLELGVTSLDSLHHSLELLKNQLMIHQFKGFLMQSIFPGKLDQGENTLRIPPFMGQTEAQTSAPFQEKVAKRLPKKIEEEMAITYGDIEFPFLSIGAENDNSTTGPLLQVSQNILSDKSNEEMPKKRKYTKLNAVFKIHKASQENERKENKANKKEKKTLKGEKIVKKAISEEKEIKEKKQLTKKPSPVKTIVNASQSLKTTKKSIKEEVKSPAMEIEESTSGTKERKSYLSFQFGKRMGEERKKNRWQVSQDIKLGDLQIPVLNISNNYALMFEGNKKKSSLIAVGSEFQVDIDLSITKSKGSNKRQPKVKWDPSAQKESDVLRLFKDVENITDAEINQEKIINYLSKNKGDIKKTKKYIKDNKSKVSQDLIIKALE